MRNSMDAIMEALEEANKAFSEKYNQLKTTIEILKKQISNEKDVHDYFESGDYNLDNYGSGSEEEVDVDGEKAARSVKKIEIGKNKVKKYKKMLKKGEEINFEFVNQMLNYIINPEKDGRVVDDEFTTTLAIVYEKFCAALVSTITLSSVQCVGGANDRGVDLVIMRAQQKIIGQCKRGNFLSTGKGNSIVLSLIGSMVLNDVKEGWLFFSEPYSALSDQTGSLICDFKEKGYIVRCFHPDSWRDLVEKREYLNAQNVYEELTSYLNDVKSGALRKRQKNTKT